MPFHRAHLDAGHETGRSAGEPLEAAARATTRRATQTPVGERSSATSRSARSPSPLALSAASRTTHSAMRSSAPISRSRPTQPWASAAQATQGPVCEMLKSRRDASSAGGERGRCETRLPTVREHDLVPRAHCGRAAGRARAARAQSRRDSHARCAPAAQCEASRIGQLRGEGPRCARRPLTPQVRLI